MRILIVEDEKKVASFIKKGLEEESFSVDAAYDGVEGEYLIMTNDYDCILLDIMLPKKDGLTLLREVRAKKIFVPVIMLTARDTTHDITEALNAGCDDYLRKPFAFEELVARVRALIRRASAEKSSVIEIDDLQLEPATRDVQRGGKKIELTSKEFALLEYLMRNSGRVLSRTIISEHVWDLHFDSGTNIVDVYINYLRNKIDKGFKRKLIHTSRGMGYVLKVQESG